MVLLPSKLPPMSCSSFHVQSISCSWFLFHPFPQSYAPGCPNDLFLPKEVPRRPHHEHILHLIPRYLLPGRISCSHPYGCVSNRSLHLATCGAPGWQRPQWPQMRGMTRVFIFNIFRHKCYYLKYTLKGVVIFNSCIIKHESDIRYLILAFQY